VHCARSQRLYAADCVRQRLCAVDCVQRAIGPRAPTSTDRERPKQTETRSRPAQKQQVSARWAKKSSPDRFWGAERAPVCASTSAPNRAARRRRLASSRARVFSGELAAWSLELWGRPRAQSREQRAQSSRESRKLLQSRKLRVWGSSSSSACLCSPLALLASRRQRAASRRSSDSLIRVVALERVAGWPRSLAGRR